MADTPKDKNSPAPAPQEVSGSPKGAPNLDQDGSAEAATPALRAPEPRAITEEDGVHKDWYVRAKSMTLDGLPAFLKELTTAYRHDYGTICHAIAAAAVAAAWAVERSPQGGITGFQAGAVMWGFIKGWDGLDGPARLLKMEDMLYPQYQRKFTTISRETWEHLQALAKEKLAANLDHAHPDVRRHWVSITEGVVPFGYTVEED